MVGSLGSSLSRPISSWPRRASGLPCSAPTAPPAKTRHTSAAGASAAAVSRIRRSDIQVLLHLRSEARDASTGGWPAPADRTACNDTGDTLMIPSHKRTVWTHRGLGVTAGPDA